MNRLKAPDEYWTLTEDDRKSLCNGCGPKSIEPLIPDKLFGLSITEA